MADGQGPPELGTLTDADLREAWPNEPRDFTPWLADNLDRLSEAIGVAMEPETTEARVGQFAADILATGPEGQSVLIENQLGGSDHSHLGQIMTYLAGLDARIVVWIARNFTEQHLSAIQWLNRHTENDFAFFAVKLRVVRIAASPLAPIFEVIAKPNNWERQIRDERLGSRSENVTRYREFGTHYAQRYPRDGVRANHGLANFWVRPRKDAPAISLTFALAAGQVGVFFTPRGVSKEAMEAWYAERRQVIRETLGDEVSFWERFDTHNKDNWDAMCDWLHEKLGRYLKIVEAEPLQARDRGLS